MYEENHENHINTMVVQYIALDFCYDAFSAVTVCVERNCQVLQSMPIYNHALMDFLVVNFTLTYCTISQMPLSVLKYIFKLTH
jgi:hypothetical protein